MSAAPLDVKVIYSASSRSGSGKRRPVRRRSSMPGSRLVILGLLNLAAASGLYYWTWWEVDRDIYMRLMLNTPIELPNAGFASTSPVPSNAADPARPQSTADTVVDTTRFQGQTARTVIGATAYGWLMLATLAACALSTSAGASFGRKAGTRWRVVGVLLALAAVAGLGWAAYRIWAEYGIEYPPSRLRMWMGGVVLTTLFIGWAMVRRLRRWTFVAALAVLFSACGSIVALYLGHRCGAIEAFQVTPKYLGTVFAAHSAWGWVLMIVAWRMVR